MSLLYPGIDDEDAMRWYENIHSMPQSTQAPPTTDLPLIITGPMTFRWGKYVVKSYFNPDVTNPLIEYGSEDMRLHGSDPDAILRHRRSHSS